MKDEIKENNSVMKCCICNNENIGEFIVIEDKKYHLNCITNLQEQLHQASLDIQELTEKDIGCPSWCDKLTNLQEENEFLKLNNPEQNMEHFRIVKENKRKIDNLRKENERLKQLCDKYEEEHSTEFKIWKDERHQLLDYKSRNEKAIEYIKDSGITFLNLANQRCFCNNNCADKIINILNGGSNE